MLVGYSYADLGDDMESKKGTTGHLLIANDSRIAWKFKIQESGSRPTLELEWTAIVSVIRHGS